MQEKESYKKNSEEKCQIKDLTLMSLADPDVSLMSLLSCAVVKARGESCDRTS